MLRVSQGRAKAKSVGEPLLSPLVIGQDNYPGAKLVFRRGQLSMVAAGPGSGKSYLVHSVVQRGDGHGNVNHGIYFSADSDAFTMFTRTVAIAKAWTLPDIEQAMNRSPADAQYMDGIAAQAAPNVWYDFTSDLSPERILSQIAAYAELQGVYPEFIVVDNLKNLEVSGGEAAEHEAQELACTFLAEVAKLTGAAVIVTHHVGGFHEDNSGAIPLSGIRNKATKTPTLVATMYRQTNGKDVSGKDLGDTMYVSIVKSRGGKASADGSYQSKIMVDFERGQFA